MKYLEITKHYQECFEKHGDNNFGVDWPNFEDTLTRHQIMFEITKHTDNNISFLDFGCGLGHFKEWLNKNSQSNINYFGLDINKDFTDLCQKKFPDSKFYCKDILIDDKIPNFDYIICNGTFTEKRNLTQLEMMNYFQETIKKLWNKCDKGISFNLMSKYVDWEREDLFHVSLDELSWFLTKNLSRNFVYRNDYKLYEFTTYVYK